MGDENDVYAGEVTKFHRFKLSIDRLVYKNTDEYREELQRILDQLNTVDYTAKLIPEEVKSLLL